jgi:hypothetical protein
LFTLKWAAEFERELYNTGILIPTFSPKLQMGSPIFKMGSPIFKMGSPIFKMDSSKQEKGS